MNDFFQLPCLPGCLGSLRIRTQEPSLCPTFILIISSNCNFIICQINSYCPTFISSFFNCRNFSSSRSEFILPNFFNACILPSILCLNCIYMFSISRCIIGEHICRSFCISSSQICGICSLSRLLQLASENRNANSHQHRRLTRILLQVVIVCSIS